MERWFLGGAVLALLILLFDKPLAEQIVSSVKHEPMAPIPLPEAAPVVAATSACSDCQCGSSSTPVQDSVITAQLAPLSSAPKLRVTPDGPSMLIRVVPRPPQRIAWASTQQLGNSVVL